MDTTRIDEVIASLARLPLEERRAAYFAELTKLPVDSQERIYLVGVRHIFARGPYDSNEFLVIAGLAYGGAPPTEEQTQRLAEHADAVVAMKAAAELWRVARFDRLAAQSAAGPQDARGARPKTSAQQARFEEAATAEHEAREHFEDASVLEVIARPHQPRKLPADPVARLSLIARARRAISS